MNTFLDAWDVISNEGDLPHKSATTGHIHGTKTSPVRSLYLAMKERNRCNRNDYQNIGVNGADSITTISNVEALVRNQANDHPLLVILELCGNDVCFSNQTFDVMTSPEDFKKNVLTILDKLNKTLPKGSHVFIWGLVDGRELYNSLAKEDIAYHPLNVTYDVFYDYMNCLKSTPCWGWMNTNESIRNKTTEHANLLNDVWRDVTKNYKFGNFDFIFHEIPFEDLKRRVIQDGYRPKEMIEPVDGFHPSQLGTVYFADWVVETLTTEHPEWLGPINPNNELIDTLFPEQ